MALCSGKQQEKEDSRSAITLDTDSSSCWRLMLYRRRPEEAAI